MSKKIFAAGAATIALFLWYLNATNTEPKPTPAPAPCDLGCLVAERAQQIHERDQAEYRQQSDLKALIEIQAELQLLTIEHKN